MNLLDENVIGLSLQEILPDNNNIKTEKMLIANPPNILKRSKFVKMNNAVSTLQKMKKYYILDILKRINPKTLDLIA